MKKIFPQLAILFLLATSAFAQFEVEAVLDGDVIRLEASVPAKHYLYAKEFKVTDALGNEQKVIELPTPASIIDPFSGKKKPVFDQSFKAVYSWTPEAGGAAAFHVHYMGCNDETCFMPQEKVVALETATEKPGVGQPAGGGSSGWELELENFEILKTGVGYMNTEKMLAFLGTSVVEASDGEGLGGFRLFLSDPEAFVRESGLVLTLIFILIGGLALNLTPCVLPMIPINLAIIGAGAQAGSKGRGFALGAMYGLGIALVYGLLGVVVVLTGSQFGEIQSSPWFNLVIAVIFILLALAMFDVFHIDLTRFQSKMGGGEQKQGSFLLALTMGSVAALLAGACVAPVVIAVLLLATNIYEASGFVGLSLPFVLGFGMALPWPFAGAGLSFLPKPGKWMEYVKYAFGVGIILFALYYGQLSYKAFKVSTVFDANKKLAQELAQARKEGKPVFIDFGASWCKNCKAMDKTTFKDEAVKARLDGYVFIKYAAEKFDDPAIKVVTDHFEVKGLPTYVVLAPVGDE